MRKFLSFRGFVVGALLGLAFAAAAQTVVYFGYNPATQLNVTNGIPVAGGLMPTLTAATSCGTLATVQASEVGGGAAVQVTANATTCTLVFSLPVINGVQITAPNGLYCVAADETTPADSMKQSAHTTSSCTLTGTVVLSDKVIVDFQGF